jgi:protein-S-isoprenylcysteine O-methyltransferase Ste14
MPASSPSSSRPETAEGERLPSLGPRGEGWFAVQLLLMAAIGLSALLGLDWPDALEVPAVLAGALLIAAGIALIVLGGVQLGSALTPLPAPREGAELAVGGVYLHVRHPIYGGVVLVALGWALLFASVVGVVLTLLLAAFLELKARREEAWLVAHHPEYEEYRRRTRRKLLPWIY